MSAPTRCAICGREGEAYCRNTVGCNFRARRRLGMPYPVCVEWADRDRERIALGRRIRRGLT